MYPTISIATHVDLPTLPPFLKDCGFSVPLLPYRLLYRSTDPPAYDRLFFRCVDHDHVDDLTPPACPSLPPSLALSPFLSLPFRNLMAKEWKIDSKLSTRGGVAKATKTGSGQHNHASDSSSGEGGGREIWL